MSSPIHLLAKEYAPVYTSMVCEVDQEYNDEPYAIFWGMNWRDKSHIKSFVRKTRVYKNIDDGEDAGFNNRSDDKVLTTKYTWEKLDTEKHFILVQAMENDGGSPTYIVKALRKLLPLDITSLILADKPRDEIVTNAKKIMARRIDLLRGLAGLIIKQYLAEEIDIMDLVWSINEDDRIGNPQELSLSDDRPSLTFSGDHAKYTYKFLNQSRITPR